MPAPLILEDSTVDIYETESSQIDITEPEARQRAFLQGRLAGTATPAEVTLATPAEQPPSTPRGVSPTPPLETITLAAHRRQQLTEFRARQFDQLTQTAAVPAAAVPSLATAQRGLEPVDFVETNRWTLIGPTVVREGQSGKQPAMSGRVRDLAIAPGGQRVYVASANGGVWRSEDGGGTWLSLMDAFDLNPTLYRADSLACGAIALVPGTWAGQDTIYVGSGEPGVVPWFQGDSAYFGVGPIVSTDGGLHWITEPSEPSLAGRAFYALAIDPLMPQRVIAATIDGLYRRERNEADSYHWVQKKSGYFCSVVVAHRNDKTTFYAAAWYGDVWESADGETWQPLPNGFPARNDGSTIGRVGLAVQEDNPTVIYALVANQVGHLYDVFRLDRKEGDTENEAKWRSIRHIPRTLFGPDLQRQGQGGYDLAIVIDPTDVNRIYIGGSIVRSDGIQPVMMGGDWSGSLYRCEIEVHPTTGNVEARPTYIGGAIHGDIHALQFAPGTGEQLWVGCDGGVFFANAPTADPLDPAHFAGIFLPRNTGLSTLTMNYLAMHPTEDALLFCGTQDNGGLRYTGDPVWLYSSGGDSGYFVINWHDPYQVITTYVQNQIYRSSDGGRRYSYQAIHVLPANGEAAQFYAPLVGTPYTPETPACADRIAFGGTRVWLSEHFGGTGLMWNGQTWIGEVDWRSLPNNNANDDWLEGTVDALTFASANKLYAGTINGLVYRFDLLAIPQNSEEQTNHEPGDGVQSCWLKTKLPNIASAEENARYGPVTAIAVDPTEPSGNAIYVTLGGMENPHRVWHFDGIHWHPCSGRGTTDNAEAVSGLLDVQHNAIVVDPKQPDHLYVAADIGVWRSVNGGNTWAVFSHGLPDAAVVDLKLHEQSRLLRAATHGRGIYEFDLGRPQQAIDLYIRDHILDLGRTPSVGGLPDPTRPGTSVRAGTSPDIKIDTLTAEGTYQFASVASVDDDPMDFYTFTTGLQDRTEVVTHSRANLQTYVYIQVHNRGTMVANNVHVMLLLATQQNTDSSPVPGITPTYSLPPLPEDYEQNVRITLPIASDAWQTVGQAQLHGIRPGYPQIATFVLNADMLPTPGQLRETMTFSLVAFVHATDDPFVAESATIVTPVNNRHVAHQEIQVVPFTGKVPSGTPRRQRQRPKPDQWLAEHEVQRGETLSHIAKHYYDSAREWPIIYRANRRLIGADPNHLREGDILKIPQL